jgi:hypothetical protein
MAEIAAVLARWQLDMRHVRSRTCRTPAPRERERWHALCLLAQGWSASKVAELLAPPHTIGNWLAALDRDGPDALAFEQTGGSPRPRRGRAGQGEGGSAGRAGGGRHRPGEPELEGGAGGRRGARWGPTLPQRLHALSAPAGLRPQAPQATPAQGRRGEARRLRGGICRPADGGAKVFFADSAYFRADGDLRETWVLKGQPDLVDSSCPHWGERASDYAAV